MAKHRNVALRKGINCVTFFQGLVLLGEISCLNEKLNKSEAIFPSRRDTFQPEAGPARPQGQPY